jgi:tetratricopeptide (TPR) repeat protein
LLWPGEPFDFSIGTYHLQQNRLGCTRGNRSGRELTVRSFALPVLLLAAFHFVGMSRGHASSVEDADQLYANALSVWDRSTSPEVEDLLRRALALQRSALPPTDERITQTLNRLGRVFYNRGVAKPDSHKFPDLRQFEEAMVWFDEALSLTRLAGDRDRTLLSDYVSDLAAAQREAGHAARALPNACEGLHIRLSLRPLLIDRVLRSLVNLARTRAALGDQREADRLFNDVKAIQTTPQEGFSIGKSAYEQNCEAALVS